MVDRHLSGWDLSGFDFLFIENIGNLVCPAAWDLGERRRVGLLSAIEGEDTPLKYPKLFHTADVVVFTKMDLAEACEFDSVRAAQNVHAIRSLIGHTSAKRGLGMEESCQYLASFHLAPTNAYHVG